MTWGCDTQLADWAGFRGTISLFQPRRRPLLRRTRAEASSPPVHKRIHITGAHRSGTTLMWALMTTCFDIDVSPPGEERLRAPLASRGPIVCTKRPDESDYAFKLLPFDPNLHVIQMIRDPRDVIASKYGPGPAPYFATLPSWRRNRPPRRIHPRAHVVSYERLVRTPDAVQKELMAGMPFLRAVSPFSRFSERAQTADRPQSRYWAEAMHSIRPPSPESIGRWREHLPRVKGQIARHGDISRDLIALGLEPDTAWLTLLDGVDADLTPSHLPETEPLKAPVTRAWRNALGILSYLRERRREKREERATI